MTYGSARRVMQHLSMRYKGERNYLQGADLYKAVVSAVIDQCGERGYTGQLTFHRFARNQCDLFIDSTENRPIAPAERVMDGVFKGDAGEWVVWLMETSRPVDERYPFDEEPIFSASVIQNDTIRSTASLPYDAIDIAISMTKRLHNTTYPLPEQRWILSKLEFLRLIQPSDTDSIRVRLMMNLHNRITKSELWSDDQLLGYIYFSAVSK